jgi:hypothetical protein
MSVWSGSERDQPGCPGSGHFLIEVFNDFDQAADPACGQLPAAVHQGLVVAEPCLRFGQFLRRRAGIQDFGDDDIVDRAERGNDIVAGERLHGSGFLKSYGSQHRSSFTTP